MLYSKRLSDDVIEIYGGEQPSSNIYLIISTKALIDLGSKLNSYEAIKELKKYDVNPEDIETIIFTHLHFDHTGNPLLFKNAVFYASKEEINGIKTKPDFTDPILKKMKINELADNIAGMEVITTPGHTAGSICLWKEDDGILFTGDTLFRNGAIGRTDLPTSKPKDMQKSLMKLIKYPRKEVAAGHNLEKTA